MNLYANFTIEIVLDIQIAFFIVIYNLKKKQKKEAS